MDQGKHELEFQELIDNEYGEIWEEYVCKIFYRVSINDLKDYRLFVPQTPKDEKYQM